MPPDALSSINLSSREEEVDEKFENELRGVLVRLSTSTHWKAQEGNGASPSKIVSRFWSLELYIVQVHSRLFLALIECFRSKAGKGNGLDF